MQNITLAVHRAGDAYRSVVSSLTATSTESRFIESGTLTPEEFVQAGDQLTFKFPTWQWETGEASRRATYLPPERQFLITRNVPCKDRVRALDYVLDHRTRTEDEWLVPETATGTQANDNEELQDIDDFAATGVGGFGGADASGPIIVAQEDFINSDAAGAGLPDFSDLDAALVEDDHGRGGIDSTERQGDYLVADAPDEHILRTRTYDLSITYDKYYQTPRLWLFGYDERGEPLAPDQVYEDVLSEYVAKTVTVDPHPLTGIATVSIHPCKHAQVMKKVVQDWIDQGIVPRHDLALFVFLKFISGVVPTINYDFTMDIEF
jgi:ubiquitin-like-conjugating enzyme ATG3